MKSRGSGEHGTEVSNGEESSTFAQQESLHPAPDDFGNHFKFTGLLSEK